MDTVHPAMYTTHTIEPAHLLLYCLTLFPLPPRPFLPPPPSSSPAPTNHHTSGTTSATIFTTFTRVSGTHNTPFERIYIHKQLILTRCLFQYSSVNTVVCVRVYVSTMSMCVCFLPPVIPHHRQHAPSPTLTLTTTQTFVVPISAAVQCRAVRRRSIPRKPHPMPPMPHPSAAVRRPPVQCL